MQARQVSNEIQTPTPTLILALDPFGRQVARDVLALLKTCLPSQAAMTTIYALAADTAAKGAAGWKFQELSRWQEDLQTGINASDRKSTFDSLLSDAPRLERALETAFHDLQTHERLLQVGLGQQHIIPLDVIVLADLNDVQGSGAIIPIATQLQHLLANEVFGMGHLLLTTARFSSKDTERHHQDAVRAAQSYLTLLDLISLSGIENSPLRNHLAKALKLDQSPPLNFQIYLFDHRKEGVRQVKDRAELCLIVSNFLVTLLSGGTARRLLDRLPSLEAQERQAYFSSAAASAVVLATQPFVDRCTHKNSAAFLDYITQPGEMYDLAMAPQLAEEITTALGNLRLWLTQLTQRTMLEVQDEGDTAWLHLHLTELQFEGCSETQWAELIREYEAAFTAQTGPLIREQLGHNLETLVHARLVEMKDLIVQLPPMIVAQAGGLAVASEACELILAWLADWEEVVRAPTPEPAQMEAALITELETLAQAAHLINPIPPLLGRMLKIINLVVDVGPFVRWWRYRDTDLMPARARCLKWLEKKQARCFEQIVRTHLLEFLESLRDEIIREQNVVAALNAKLMKLKQYFETQAPGYQTVEATFRPSPAGHKLADWCYERWRPPLESMCQTLIRDEHFFCAWQAVTADDFKKILLEYGQKVFAPVHELSLEEAVQHGGQWTASALIAYLSQSTIPLLRTNFDAIGGDNYAQPASYLLASQSQSEIAVQAKQQLDGWEVIAAGSDKALLCCKVRQLIPLQALQDLQREGTKALAALNDDEKAQVQLITMSAP